MCACVSVCTTSVSVCVCVMSVCVFVCGCLACMVVPGIGHSKRLRVKLDSEL